MDPQTGFQAIKNLLPGVLIDNSGAADNVPKVDVRIRRLKEIYRAVKNGIPWNLPTGHLPVPRSTTRNHCHLALETTVKSLKDQTTRLEAEPFHVLPFTPAIIRQDHGNSLTSPPG